MTTQDFDARLAAIIEEAKAELPAAFALTSEKDGDVTTLRVSLAATDGDPDAPAYPFTARASEKDEEAEETLKLLRFELTDFVAEAAEASDPIGFLSARLAKSETASEAIIEEIRRDAKRTSTILLCVTVGIVVASALTVLFFALGFFG